MNFDQEVEKTTVAQTTTFAEDVHNGLIHSPKKLPSKYFYDKVGDKIFQEIMEMEEYYLTRAEYDIFQDNKQDILNYLTLEGETFRLLELGAGDGKKTKVLLEHFVNNGIEFTYSPVDISANVLDILHAKVSEEIPDLTIKPLVGDYFDVLSEVALDDSIRDVVFFLGSNIGNFNNAEATGFLRELHASLKKGDLVFIGFDLKKDPNVILNAYNDSSGITARFNLNLLERINNELGGNINIDSFKHYPIYNPATGDCKSYLINTKKQEFRLEATGKTYFLDDWEPIFTEVSKKYGEQDITGLAKSCGFSRIMDFYDENRYFVDTLWKVI